MLSGKSLAQTRPTALGSMLQASTYGATIPTIYGCVKSPLLAVWAQNLRQGGSGKKAKKKGITTYVENIDFLIGSNPIQGMLQFWGNNNARYPLNFVKYDTTIGGASTITIPDPHFYFLIGVTAEVSLSGAFNDYGGQGSSAWGPTVYEYPLWNAALHGPDLIDASGARWFPFVYKWVPGDGPVVALPFVASFMAPAWGIPNGNGNIHLYYAQLSALTNYQAPAAKFRLTFESQLGNNNAAYAGFTSQQTIFPEFAGASSPNYDLGATGMIQLARPEILGSFSTYPRGDADFLDMIEDVLKSGMMQVGAQLGQIHRGVNLNDLPGAIQKNFFFQLEPLNPMVKYWQPNTAGNVLVAFCRWRSSAGGTAPTIADAAANAWNPIVLGSGGQNYGMWYATAVAAAAGNGVTFTNHLSGGFAYDDRPYIVEMDPGSTSVDNTNSATGSGSTASCSITVTGSPTYILAALYTDTAQTSLTPPFHWNDLFPSSNHAVSMLLYRIVATPGTYTVKIALPSGGNWALGLIALKNAQTAPPYTKALGNILDPATALNARAGCRANGLFGSASLDSQKKAADWLAELLACANTAAVWSGQRLKLIFRSEVSAVGNGQVYTAPTSSGPVLDITEDMLIGDSSGPLITITDKTPAVDDPNIRQIEFLDRDGDYNPSVASWPEQSSISIYGPKKDSPKVLHEIVDPVVARKLLAIEARRNALVKPRTYKFKGKANLGMLEPMDLVTINDSLVGISHLPVRLTSTAEDDKHNIDCEAEPFLYGVHAPDSALIVTPTTPYQPNSNIIPASVNPPIIFEPPLRMCLSGKPELWLVVSDSDPNYGGCIDYVSTDGGSSFHPLGTTDGNATTGEVTADWPAHADSDPTNPLSVDLTESIGSLASYTASDENNFLFPCYVAATPPPTPSFSGGGAQYGGIEPVECVGHSGGMLVVARTRGQDLSFWPGLPSGVIRFRTVPSGLCGDVDHYFVHDTPTGLCPCGAQGGIPGLIPSSPPTFRYDFEVVTVNLNDAGSLGGIAELAFPASPPAKVSLNEVTFDGSDMGSTSVQTFGGTVLVVEIRPASLGNPSYYVAFVSGLRPGYSHPPTGWTTLLTGTLIQVFGRAGTISQPPGANYELMTYQGATLTSLYNYTLPASAPAPLRRAVFGMPVAGQGEDHGIGTRFAWLNAWNVATVPGILKVQLDPTWIGKTLHFKFTAFNALLGGVQALSDATDYIYTPVGLASGINSGSGTSGQSGQPAYTISGGALTNPTSTTIDMAQATATFPTNTANYNARVFTIPVPTAPTTYYVTIFDPGATGDTGSSTNLAAFCQASNALVGVPGYVFIGAITVLPAGGGTMTTPGGFPQQEQILVNGV
jgi:hypothetical protein